MSAEHVLYDPRLCGVRGRLLQAAWLVFALATTGLYLIGLAIGWKAPQTLCVTTSGACTEAAATAELARFGLSPGLALAVAFLLGDIGVPVGCLLMASFIFWRRPDRSITLAVAAVLAIYGTAVNTGLVDSGLAWLGLRALSNPFYLLFEGLLYFVLLTFPNGQFWPRWSWWVLVAGVAASAGQMLLVRNIPDSGPLSFVIVFVVALALQVYRYRRLYSASERQQSKWVLVGMVAFFLNAALYVAIIEPASRLGASGLPYLYLFSPLNFLLVLSFPATLLIASLRYRLWDIDVFVRRTLVYSVLTTLLALIYLSSVIVLQGTLLALTGQRQNTLVTVLSTLTIAALFGPLRSRVQSAIDRRFYRRKYDAARISAAVSATLQADTYAELDHVAAQLIETVDATLQPSHATLWLKPTRAERQTVERGENRLPG